jgi:geranylgeranyl reductase family protein
LRTANSEPRTAIMSHSDVIVVGAGPAGSIAALVLARAGARVRLIDRARFPRDKLCGDTVNPGALQVLTRLGIDGAARDGLAVDGMIVTGPSGVRCEGRYGAEHQGRALRRQTLDRRLLASAIHAGASFDEGVLVQGPLMDGTRVRGVRVGDGHSHSLTASFVIAADGAASRLARALKLSAHCDRPRRWAVGAYFENVGEARSGALLGEMHIRPDRYIGVAPLESGVTNVCVVTADREALRDPAALLCGTLRSDSVLAPRFARARTIEKPVCLGPLGVDNTSCGVPGLLLAGDAAGFIDPMTGDGLRFAFRGGELAGLGALSALETGTFDAARWLADQRRREFRPKWRFNRVLRTLVASPRAMTVAGSAARQWPSVIERIVQYAGDTGITYDDQPRRS